MIREFFIGTEVGEELVGERHPGRERKEGEGGEREGVGGSSSKERAS